MAALFDVKDWVCLALYAVLLEFEGTFSDFAFSSFPNKLELVCSTAFCSRALDLATPSCHCVRL
jgi:hypothetical protein